MKLFQYMKQILLIVALVCSTYMLNAQFGYGLTITNDIYNRYTNPDQENIDVYEGNGSLLLNLGLGPKIWIGAPQFSFSLETQAKIGLMGVALKDFKGMVK